MNHGWSLRSHASVIRYVIDAARAIELNSVGWTVQYSGASWTLKVERVADFVCRPPRVMARTHAAKGAVAPRPGDAVMARKSG